jgi:peptidyl-tRNA hydrolase
MNLPHLARRFFTSLSRRPPPNADRDWAHSWLDEGERDLWNSMPPVDRRHSIEVARRFQERRRAADREEMAGALLHDVGKTASGFGTFTRVIATIVGPRTKRLRDYHDHEAIGAAMAEAAGSAPVTVALVRGDGPAADDLEAADDSI